MAAVLFCMSDDFSSTCVFGFFLFFCMISLPKPEQRPTDLEEVLHGGVLEEDSGYVRGALQDPAVHGLRARLKVLDLHGGRGESHA